MSGLQAAGHVTATAVAGVGIAAAAAFAIGIKGAADLEVAMVSIRNATGATQGQMEMLRETAFQVSAATAQSVTQSARVMAVMASAGINDPERLRQIAMPAALFADVQFLKSQGRVSFEQGATQAIQLAHLFQRYTPEAIMPIYDKLTKLSFMMPHSLDRFLTQAGYYMPAFRRLGVDDDQALVAGAFLDRMGLGRGKGGTGLQNFVMQQMQGFALTKHQMETRGKALQDLGLVNPDMTSKFYRVGADGKPHFDVLGSLAAIDQAVTERTRGLHGHALEKRNAELVSEIQKALNVQGGRIGFLGTPEAIAQLHQMIRDLEKIPGLYTLQGRSMDTLQGRYQQFTTNFSSLLTDVMSPWLDTFKTKFHELALQAQNMQTWLHKHPAVKAGVSVGVAGVAVGGTTAALLFGWQVMSRLAGFSGPMGVLVPLVARLGLLLMGPVGWTIGIGLAIAGMVQLIKHAKDIGNMFGDVAYWINTKGAPMWVEAMQKAVAGLGPAIGNAFRHLWGDPIPGATRGGAAQGIVDWFQTFKHAADNQYLYRRLHERYSNIVPVPAGALPHLALPPHLSTHRQRLVRHAGGGGGAVHVHGFTINYHEDGRPDTPATRRERNHKVRELAANVFRAAADVARTSSRAMAGGIHLAGMSPLELGGEAYI